MWYARQLENLSLFPGVKVEFYNHDYGAYDVILFMGYNPQIAEAKKINPKAQIGVIDARPAAKKAVSGADFLIANGIEMQDWYAKVTPYSLIYPPYPVVGGPNHSPRSGDTIVLGYHGNKVHLQAMFPRITHAIEQLAVTRKVEVWALYNKNELGQWRIGVPRNPNVVVRHMQWTESGYEELLKGTDIGIVPNFMPLQDRFWSGSAGSASPRIFLDDDTDYVTRYKASSNAGRIFVFAQKGIPVVSDMYPSALQLILQGSDGFLCYSTASWYRALDRLTADPELRKAVGGRLQRKYESE